MEASTSTETQRILSGAFFHSLSDSKPISEAYEQTQQIYQDIFGVDPISPLDIECLRSGQLLNDIYALIFPELSTISRLVHDQKLQQLIQILDPTRDSLNSIWCILLPEYHLTNSINWDQLLELFHILNNYTSKQNKITRSITPSSQSTQSQSSPTQQMSSPTQQMEIDPNPASFHTNAFQTNPCITINDHPLKSFTPPLAKCSNLLQKSSFLTEQQHRSFRKIHFADSNIILNRSAIHEQPEYDGDAKAVSEDVDEASTSAFIKTDTKAIASPPRHQILMSAKKIMSELRGKNLDAAMLASGRKIAQNKMPHSRKTKRCTPAIDRQIREKIRTPATIRNKCKLSKRLSFVKEDNPHEQKQEQKECSTLLLEMEAVDDDDDDDAASVTSHYGWKSREQSKELNITMLSHVLVDPQKEDEISVMSEDRVEGDELKDKIEELQIEISNKTLSMQEYEKKLTAKSSQCRRLQQDMAQLKINHDELSTKCQLLEQIQGENERIKSQIDKLREETIALKHEKEVLQTALNTKTGEFEEKCSSFVGELMKRERDIKEKDLRNMNVETELKTLQAKLEICKKRQSKMGHLELCTSKLLGFRADYDHLKDDVRFLLQKTSQEFRQTIETIKHGIQHGLLDPNVIQHDTYDSIAYAMKSETDTKIENDLENITSERNELKSNLLQLNVSYQQEKKLRKKLLEQIIDLKGTIRVFCRVRPKVKRKITANSNDNEVEMMATTCLDDERIVINNESNKKEFNFDRIFQPGTPQDAVFEDVRPLIHSCVDGYNVCIFAYGQTGSGKTYTMEGDHTNPGVIYRSFDELFALKDKQNGEHDDDAGEMKVFLSCLEIYNEKIRDLLNTEANTSPLKAKLSKCGKKVMVPGLTRTQVHNTEHVREILINNAYKNRSTGVTNMNEHSSRSHALVFVDIVTNNTKSRLVLIDLAGSERVKKTGCTGARFDEARAINKSLSALGNVINSLQTKQKHVPFRDSQLTYLLYDCLSGQSRALMFCNVSCEVFDVKESINTLSFANRVRRVQLGEAQKNDTNDNNHNEKSSKSNQNHSGNKLKIKKFKKEIEDKDKEINHLKMNLRNFQKEIKQLSSSIDAKNSKSSNLHAARVEFNSLQKEHTRIIQDVNKKDKIIKKLSNEVMDYKNKINAIKQKSSLKQRQSSLTRVKNPRKRKFPKDEDANNIDDDSAIQAPQNKRRKMNHYGYKPNRRERNKEKTKQQNTKKENNRKKTTEKPSYLAPTRNSRRNRAKGTMKRARSNSLDNSDKSGLKEKLESKQTRRNRVNSMDSVVSLTGATLNDVTNIMKENLNTDKLKQGHVNKSVLKAADAPLTPSSAIEAALKGRAVNKNNSNKKVSVKTKGNQKKENKTDTSSMKRKGNQPITVSSLQMRTKKNASVWK